MSGQLTIASHKETKLNHNHNNAYKNSNVRVVCRVKPLGQFEEGIDIKIDKQGSEISIPQPRQQTTKTFTFNRIFTDENQGSFVSQVCEPIIQQALKNKKGYLVFSYGVTNSGKTHTILGSQIEPGILPYLVRRLSEREQVYLSAIELYNDEFFSLANKEKLVPREINGFLDFEQCAISQPINLENMDQKFKMYLANRTQNQTKMNNKSSRSHAIFRIKAGEVTIGVVDLAGSQRTNRVFASIDETSNINKSLLCLGRCIKALNENPQCQQPIPYRESKLTRVLIEYFAAKVEVLMIANINQSQNCFHQNMKVLDYAVLAKDIQHCSSENSLKKSEFRFAAKPTTKVDIFQTLYKSAAKSTHAHKSLKSSRTKMTEKSQRSQIKPADANQKFAKALKAQQLQMYIEKFDSSQETFEYMIEYIHQKEIQEDERRIQAVRCTQYQSPFPQQTRTFDLKQYAEVGVGREEKSIELMKKQISEKMKQELRLLLEQQRLAKMESKQTEIGKSFEKQLSKQKQCNSKEQLPSLTPQKSKQTPYEDNFIMKTSSQIFSSVKKILSKNVQSMKKIIPKFIRSTVKNNEKFSIFNYGEQFQSLFKYQPCHDERTSQFSFYGNISQDQKEKSGRKIADFQTQTQFQEIKTSKHLQTQETNDLDSHSTNEIMSKQTEVTVRDSKVSINSSEKQEKAINESDQTDESNCSQETEEKSIQPGKLIEKLKAARKPKASKTKPKINEKGKRVAEARKIAAKLCREQSRTPLKKRLRNYTHY